MSNVTPTVPAGWYPDPAGTPRQRWWDGTAWTENYTEPAAASLPYTPNAAAEAAQAPAGINVYTPFIWLIALLPLVPLLALLTVDWGSIFRFDPNDPASAATASFGLLLSPGYLIALFGGFAVYGLNAFFAFRDYTYLASVGIVRPFHWAWTFLSSVVYVIGRSVVVGRRTAGQGKAPMWVAIGSVVLSFIFTIIMMIQMFAGMAESISNLNFR
ncbi:MAG: DUF2510 domain-containing protein [Rhodoglobus sp.]